MDYQEIYWSVAREKEMRFQGAVEEVEVVSSELPYFGVFVRRILNKRSTL